MSKFYSLELRLIVLGVVQLNVFLKNIIIIIVLGDKLQTINELKINLLNNSIIVVAMSRKKLFLNIFLDDF